MIWHMANIPSICATVLMPEVRYTLPKVKRVAPLMGSMPTQPMSRPIPADMMPLKMLPLDREAIRVMAQKHREKYSQGPRCRAASAITGDSTVAIATEHTVPDEGSGHADAQRLACLSLLGHGIAVKAGGNGRGRTGDADEHRRDKGTGHAADPDGKQHDKGSLGGKTKGDGQQQSDGPG